MSTFPKVETDPNFPARELSILELWSRTDAFRRSVAQRPREDAFVFYDGPPFATGLPHYGHLVPSTVKDVVPRYWTMRGKRVERRFGWDTHGLPIEMLMEKQLGLSGPSSVRAYGVDRFNEACRANVFTYVEDWRRIIGRLGRWVDFDDDYKTLDASFMESVWWAFAELWKKGLVYRSFRVMPYSWRLSTSLSNFEANLDYRDVQDPALTVTMPLEDGAVALVWTTTPWTLPSNLGVAVGADLAYVRARRPGDDTVYVVAEARLHAALGKDAEVVAGPFPGRELLGLRYRPLFPYFADTPGAFRVIAAPHVSTEDGTGLVHMAPDFGEEDFEACKAVGVGVLQSVDEEGNFRAAITDFAGRNIKEADPAIIARLKADGRVFRHETLVHSYPYCWRSGTPLIYMAVPGWFVKVSDLRDRMVANNLQIRWVPDSVGTKRFGNWLGDARDWNISRNRFWGTPIPIWECPQRHTHCVGSARELAERTGAGVDDLHPHRIDHLDFPCPTCGLPAHRISDVFDCWFESGAMPFGQAHYPFEDKEAFERSYPADFISEGLDQTRGWFYTLLVLSTALFDRPSFRNCVVNGLVLAEDGSKMSKSKQNYPPPERILDEIGADALRAYLIASPVVRGEPLRFSEAGVREVVRTVLLPFHHAHAFFVQYANLPGAPGGTSWSPSDPRPPLAERSELDRWLVSHLQSLVRDVDAHMEAYALYQVVPRVLGFVEDLTNWYIRLSRRRFWGDGPDRVAALATLYEVLVDFTKVLAPFLPFAAETVWQSLVVAAGGGPDSVHLADWPTVDPAKVDRGLERDVAHVRQVVSVGRRLREKHKLKVRQPLRRLTVVHHEAAVRSALEAHRALLLEELNVRELDLRSDGAELSRVSFKANFKTLGKRYGKDMKAAAAAIEAFGATELAALEAGGQVAVLGQPVSLEDVVVRREARGDVVIEAEGPLVVALDTEVDDALLALGLAREAISTLQKLRKDAGLAVADRIRATVVTEDPALRAALAAHGAGVAEEVLAVALDVVVGPGADALVSVRGEHRASFAVSPLPPA